MMDEERMRALVVILVTVPVAVILGTLMFQIGRRHFAKKENPEDVVSFVLSFAMFAYAIFVQVTVALELGIL